MAQYFDNYLNYRKHKPDYKSWKENRENLEAKRLAYIEKNNIKPDEADIKRTQAVLDAVDVMDEYSQSRAEDMELVVQGATQSVGGIAAYVTMGAGFLLGFLGPCKKIAEKFAPKSEMARVMFWPILASAVGAVLLQMGLSPWGAKKETEASKKGRFEAMKGDLASENHFAILTPEQEKQRDEIAKGIKIDKKEAKKTVNANKKMPGFFKSIKILTTNDEEFEKQRKEFREKVKQDEANFETVKLSEEEIKEAKKDQQLAQNIIQKIDIASQDYAEDAELATGTMQTLFLGGGGILGIGLNQILQLCKVSKQKSSIISAIVGGGSALVGMFAAVKIQKQASRVARFKVKQDFKQNPQKCMYIDDETIKQNEKSLDDKKVAEIQNGLNKKRGFFENLKQIIKDNKEYNDYLNSDEFIAKKQKVKALDEIKLTPEQQKRAKQLQHNVFKMFNKLDEKSQVYSESTEALGEVVQSVVSGLLMFPVTMAMLKFGESAQATSKMECFKPLVKLIPLTIVTTIVSAIVTKEQKQASRVAGMLAIDETKDYRNFADYSSK